MAEPSSPSSSGRTFGGHPLRAIRALDYTILFARDLPAMRKFYAEVMRFDIHQELAGNWIEFRIGAIGRERSYIYEIGQRQRRERCGTKGQSALRDCVLHPGGQCLALKGFATAVRPV